MCPPLLSTLGKSLGCWTHTRVAGFVPNSLNACIRHCWWNKNFLLVWKDPDLETCWFFGSGVKGVFRLQKAPRLNFIDPMLGNYTNQLVLSPASAPIPDFLLAKLFGCKPTGQLLDRNMYWTIFSFLHLTLMMVYSLQPACLVFSVINYRWYLSEEEFETDKEVKFRSRSWKGTWASVKATELRN